MHKCKLTDQERLSTVKECLRDHSGYRNIDKRIVFTLTFIKVKVNMFCVPLKNTYYPPELKHQALEIYLSGEDS